MFDNMNNIHLMPQVYHDAAMNMVKSMAPKGNLYSLPYMIGIGIGMGHVKVTAERRHPSHDYFLPSMLPMFGNLPVIIEERGRPQHRSMMERPRSFLSYASTGSTVTGGAQIPSGCGCTGVVVDPQGNNYLMSAAHCFGKYTPGGAVTYGGRTVANFTRSALHCGDQNNHLDASIAKLVPGVPFDYNINGLGRPTGLAQPRVGDTAIIQGWNAGKASGKITTVSYQFADKYPEISSSCNVIHKNQFEANLGKTGDSGACTWNQNGKIIGIDFAGDGIEQFSNINYLQSELGVQFGALTGRGSPSGSIPKPIPIPMMMSQQYQQPSSIDSRTIIAVAGGIGLLFLASMLFK